jgi:hypothetical protein
VKQSIQYQDFAIDRAEVVVSDVPLEATTTAIQPLIKCEIYQEEMKKEVTRAEPPPVDEVEVIPEIHEKPRKESLISQT